MHHDLTVSHTLNHPETMAWRGLIGRAAVGLARGWRAYCRYKRLATLSDQALATQGLERHEIGRMAFFRDDE
ncbi:MAG: hypothetical protein ACR2Q4_14805 [Geminicoccaceae bacterium]